MIIFGSNMASNCGGHGNPFRRWYRARVCFPCCAVLGRGARAVVICAIWCNFWWCWRCWCQLRRPAAASPGRPDPPSGHITPHKYTFAHSQLVKCKQTTVEARFAVWANASRNQRLGSDSDQIQINQTKHVVKDTNHFQATIWTCFLKKSYENDLIFLARKFCV